MTTKTEATPRPWTFETDATKCNLVAAENERGIKPWVAAFGFISHTDAAFIVEAVNSYDALKKQNEALYRVLKMIDRETLIDAPDYIWDAVKDALALAEKGE